MCVQFCGMDPPWWSRQQNIARPLGPFLDKVFVNELIQRLDLLVDTRERGPTSSMPMISVRTGERFEVRSDPGSPGRHEVRIPTVEVWIGGKRFTHDCASDSQAREMVFTTALDLGLER